MAADLISNHPAIGELVGSGAHESKTELLAYPAEV